MHHVETMVFAGEKPWHYDETRPLELTGDDVYDIETVKRKAGLGWKVGLEPLFLQDGSLVDHRAVRRATDKHVLGVVGPDWTPYQNEQMLDWFQPWLESKAVSFEAAGSLKGGKVVWALGKIAGIEGEVSQGDHIQQYLRVSQAHDGTMSIRPGFTRIREVCWNTLSASLRDSESKLLSVQHRKNAAEKMDSIQEIVDLARKEFTTELQDYKKLASTRLQPNQAIEFAARVIADEATAQRIMNILSGAEKQSIEAEARESATSKRFESIVGPIEAQSSNLVSKDVSARMLNIIADVTNRTLNGIGNHGETLWDAYNGYTEYLTWGRGKSADARLHSQWFGDSQKQNAKALKVALAMAA